MQSIDMKCSLFGQFFIFITLFVHLAITLSIDGSSNWPGVNSRKSIAGMNLNKRKYPSQQPSTELQTIMSGNWHKMDPASLFKLVNSLATSKETLPDDYYDDSFEDDYYDPIDLVYSGRSKPFLESPSSRSTIPTSSSHSRGVPPFPEPISIMSSKMHHLPNGYGEAQPLQKHRLNKKLYQPFPRSIPVLRRPIL